MAIGANRDEPEPLYKLLAEAVASLDGRKKIFYPRPT